MADTEGLPNLDASSVDELQVYKETFQELAEYCTLAQLAHLCRHSGHIAKALRYEAQMEQIYTYLPDWAKW